MSTFNQYTIEVEVLGYIDDASWHVFDLAPLLQNTDALAVTIRITKQGATNRELAVREIGSSNEGTVTLGNALFASTIVNLNGGTSVEIWAAASTATHIYITGELLDNCQCHPISILLDLGTPVLAWNTEQTVTVLGDDSVSDVTAVLLTVYNNAKNIAWSYGYRARGGMGDIGFVGQRGGLLWVISQVDSLGRYDVYDAAGAISYREVGYFKENANIFSIDVPVDLELPAAGPANYLEKSLAGIVPGRTLNTGIRLRNGGVNRIGFVRAVGGIQEGQRVVHAASDQILYCELTKNFLFEYALHNDSIDGYVAWYETLDPQGKPTIRQIKDDDLLSASIDSDQNFSVRSLQSETPVSANLDNPGAVSFNVINKSPLLSAHLEQPNGR